MPHRLAPIGLVALLLSGIVAGCSCEEVLDTGFSEGDFCFARVRGACARAAACAGEDPGGCDDQARSRCAGAPEEPDESITAEHIQACQDGWSRMSCEDAAAGRVPPECESSGATDNMSGGERCRRTVEAACERSNACNETAVDCAAAADRACSGSNGPGVSEWQQSQCEAEYAALSCEDLASGIVPLSCARTDAGGVSEREWCERTTEARCERQGGPECGGALSSATCAEVAAQACAGLSDAPTTVPWTQLFACTGELLLQSCGQQGDPPECGGAPDGDMSLQEWCQAANEVLCYRRAECGEGSAPTCQRSAQDACRNVANGDAGAELASGALADCMEAAAPYGCDEVLGGGVPYECTLGGAQQGPGGLPRDEVCEAILEVRCEQAATCSGQAGSAAACPGQAALICAGVGHDPSGWSAGDLASCLAAVQAQGCSIGDALPCWGPWTPGDPPGPGLGSGGVEDHGGGGSGGGGNGGGGNGGGGDGSLSNLEVCMSTVLAACERAGSCGAAGLDCATAAARACAGEGPGPSGVSAAQQTSCEAAIAAQACDATGSPASCSGNTGSGGPSELQWCKETTVDRCLRQGGSGCGGVMDPASCEDLAARVCAGLSDVPGSAGGTGASWLDLFGCGGALGAQGCGDGASPGACSGGPDGSLTNQEWCEVAAELVCYATAACEQRSSANCRRDAAAACTGVANPDADAGLASGAVGRCQQAAANHSCDGLLQGEIPEACTTGGGLTGPGGLPREEVCRAMYQARCEQLARCASPPVGAGRCAADAILVCSGVGTGGSGITAGQLQTCQDSLAAGCSAIGSTTCWGGWTPGGPGGTPIGSGGLTPGSGTGTGTGTGNGNGTGSTGDGGVESCLAVEQARCEREAECSGGSAAGCPAEAAVICSSVPGGASGPPESAVDQCLGDLSAVPCGSDGTIPAGVPTSCEEQEGGAPDPDDDDTGAGGDGGGQISMQTHCQHIHDAVCARANQCGNATGCSTERERVCSTYSSSSDSGPEQAADTACTDAIAASSCATLDANTLPSACTPVIGFGLYATEYDWCMFAHKTTCEQEINRCLLSMDVTCEWVENPDDPEHPTCLLSPWEQWLQDNGLVGASCEALAGWFCGGRSRTAKSCATSEGYPNCIEAARSMSCLDLIFHGIPTACEASTPGWGFQVSRNWCRSLQLARCHRVARCQGVSDSVCDGPTVTQGCDTLDYYNVCVSQAMANQCIADIGTMSCSEPDLATPDSCRTFPLVP